MVQSVRLVPGRQQIFGANILFTQIFCSNIFFIEIFVIFQEESGDWSYDYRMEEVSKNISLKKIFEENICSVRLHPEPPG